MPCKNKSSNSSKGTLCPLSTCLIAAEIHAGVWQLPAMVKEGWRTYRHLWFLLHHPVSNFCQNSLERPWNNPLEKKWSISQHHNRGIKWLWRLSSLFCLPTLRSPPALRHTWGYNDWLIWRTLYQFQGRQQRRRCWSEEHEETHAEKTVCQWKICVCSGNHGLRLNWDNRELIANSWIRVRVSRCRTSKTPWPQEKYPVFHLFMMQIKIILSILRNAIPNPDL